MPRPLRIPANPDASLHIRAPGKLLDAVAAYTAQKDDRNSLVRSAIARSRLGFEKRLVPLLDLNKTWDMVIFDDQSIAHLPVNPKQTRALSALLRPLPRKGKFGAVEIPRAAGELGPKLAYFDLKARTLTLADSLRGIATGSKLRQANRRKKPIDIAVPQQEAAKYGIGMRVKNVIVTGTDYRNLVAEFQGTTGVIDIPSQIRTGTLAGMLESPRIAAGASSTYANYKTDVSNIINKAKRQVAKQNFFVRGNLQEMVKRAAGMLRQWNGRVMVGVGPRQHMMIGLGANDPGKLGKATLYFLAGLLDNLKTARTFGFGSLPRLRFARSRHQAAGMNVHILVIPNARKFVPELAALVDGRGELRLAFAFARHAGGAMIVAGPDAANVAQQWFKDTAKAKPGTGNNHLATGTLALKPSTASSLVSDLVRGSTNFDSRKLFRLTADDKPTKIVLKRGDDSIRVGLVTK